MEYMFSSCAIDDASRYTANIFDHKDFWNQKVATVEENPLWSAQMVQPFD